MGGGRRRARTAAPQRRIDVGHGGDLQLLVRDQRCRARRHLPVDVGADPPPQQLRQLVGQSLGDLRRHSGVGDQHDRAAAAAGREFVMVSSRSRCGQARRVSRPRSRCNAPLCGARARQAPWRPASPIRPWVTGAASGGHSTGLREGPGWLYGSRRVHGVGPALWLGPRGQRMCALTVGSSPPRPALRRRRQQSHCARQRMETRTARFSIPSRPVRGLHPFPPIRPP